MSHSNGPTNAQDFVWSADSRKVVGRPLTARCRERAPFGSKATLECPASMAYGDVMKPGIPENSDLVFDVELLDCVKEEMNNVDISQL